MFGGSIQIPDPRFNLLYLEAKELYIQKLEVEIVIGKDNIQNNQITVEKCKGYLHLCSRSFIFEPLQMNLPILKIKFSSNLSSKQVNNINYSKLDQIYPAIQRQLQTNYDIFRKKESPFFTSQNFNSILMKKLYQVGSQLTLIDKSSNVQALFINVDKLFTVGRNPLTPQITENVYFSNLIDQFDDVLMFEIKSSKQIAEQYFNLYQTIIKADDETQFFDEFIQDRLNNAIESYKVDQSIKFIQKTQKITPEGIQYGILIIYNSKEVVFKPILNDINQTTIQFNLDNIKAFLKYRQSYQQIQYLLRKICENIEMRYI